MAELEQAVEAAGEATTKCDETDEDMFQLDAKFSVRQCKVYAWNKIVQEQTNADPYTDPQRLTKKGPRGLLCKS